jgi:hypothetical protein
MKLNIQKHLSSSHNYDDIVVTAFLAVITEWERDTGGSITDAFKSDEDGNVDAQLLINGIEVPFDEIMVRFEKEYHRYVNRQACFILVQKARKMMDVLYSMEHALKEKADELFPDRDFDKDD